MPLFGKRRSSAAQSVSNGVASTSNLSNSLPPSYENASPRSLSTVPPPNYARHTTTLSDAENESHDSTDSPESISSLPTSTPRSLSLPQINRRTFAETHHLTSTGSSSTSEALQFSRLALDDWANQQNVAWTDPESVPVPPPTYDQTITAIQRGYAPSVPQPYCAARSRYLTLEQMRSWVPPPDHPVHKIPPEKQAKMRAKGVNPVLKAEIDEAFRRNKEGKIWKRLI